MVFRWLVKVARVGVGMEALHALDLRLQRMGWPIPAVVVVVGA
jgi:hypothetical protein